MKTVIIVLIVVLFIRIDYILGLFDKASEKISNSSQIEVNETKSNREIIPLNKDLAFQRTGKETFLALLEDFRTSPTADIRERAMLILKDSPSMFNQKLDKDLETHIYGWRDLLNNNDPQVVNFMLELMKKLQGENLEMLKRFFALWMDINMKNFIAAYARTSDSNCTVASFFGDAIPEEEKLNEYYDRQDALQEVLKIENLEASQKALATNCLLQLGIVISKLAPAEAPAAPPAASTTVSPDSVESASP